MIALGLSVFLFVISVTPAWTLSAAPLGRILVPRQADAAFLGLVIVGAVAVGLALARVFG
jgi:hypothetical protein